MKRFWWHRPKKALAVQKILRVLLGIAMCGILVSTIYIGKRPYRYDLRKGDVCLEAIYAPEDFSFQGRIDEVKTQNRRKIAMEKVVDVYDIHVGVTDRVLRDLALFFRKVKDVSQKEGMSLSEKIVALKADLPIELSERNLRIFLENETIDDTEKKTGAIIKELMARHLLSLQERQRLLGKQRDRIVIRDTLSGTEKEGHLSELLAAEDSKEGIEELAIASFPESRRLRDSVGELVEKILRPNLVFNNTETTKRRQEASRMVSPIYKQIEVKKGEIIIAKGQRVTEDHLLRLKELEDRQPRANRLLLLSGASLIIIVFMVIMAIYLKNFEPKVFSSNRQILLVSLSVLFIIVVAKLVSFSPYSYYLIPVPSVSMLIAILVGPRLAFLVTAILGVFTGIIVGNKFGVMAVCLIGGTVGIYSVWRARRRSQLLRAGLLVGLANFAGIVGIELLGKLELSRSLIEGLWGVANGIISAFIVTGMLPIFEYLFKAVTNISLLELSDLNHPLLKKMANKAAGTYHHSLVVGNLAESASEAVGANPLLARVSSYFHDIGKIEKAEYFAENQKTEEGKHQKLTPTMSRLVITNHTKDGVELAHKYKLNEAIIDIIRQHHGTGVIHFFYQRALEEKEDAEQIKEEVFRYPGPKPQTKEAAIVLLADSVEAASRTLSEPTPSRIEELVQKVINNKFIDNQLDECELTLLNLHVISDSFVRTLTGVFHARIEYPDKKGKNETKKK